MEQIIRGLITKTQHLSLATASENKPWVCEVHFVYDDELNLYFISDRARRHSQDIAVNSNVAGNIVAQHAATEPPKGLYFEGIAEEYPATEKDIQYYIDTLQRPEVLVRKWLETGSVMYRISVKNWAVFGDFGDGTKKQELKWGTI